MVNKTSLSQSTLGKQHNAVNFNVVRGTAAAGILRVGKEDTETNLADLLTKILGWQKQHKLLPNILYLN